MNGPDRPAATDAAPDRRNDARIALACLDLTSLNDGDTEADIERLLARAASPFGPVAAVCVWPRFVAFARARLPAGIGVATVANFPAGGDDAERAVRETRAIVEAGGDEVDVVLPWRAFARGEVARCRALLDAVRLACEGRTLKVIVESGELRAPALIGAAATLALDAGADFVKTSTGKTAVGATPEAAAAMLAAIAAHRDARDRAGFKASGGVRRVADAARYAALVRRHLGEEALGPARFRIGASALLDDILATLGAGPARTGPTEGY